MTRSEIVAEARSWIGTPYRHQASRKRVGADCLGLVRGVWRTCIGPEPLEMPPYSPDWAELTGKDTLMDAAKAFLAPRPVTALQPGDVVIFRMATGVPAKHCAIVSRAAGDGAARIVHAYWGRGVRETRLVPWWARRVAANFTFPGLETDQDG